MFENQIEGVVLIQESQTTPGEEKKRSVVYANNAFKNLTKCKSLEKNYIDVPILYRKTHENKPNNNNSNNPDSIEVHPILTINQLL